MNIDTGSFRALKARADAVDVVTGDVAGLGELVSGLTAEVAVLAATLADMAGSVSETDVMIDIMLSARRDGYARGVAASDAHSAVSRAQQRRAGLRLVESGSGARKARRGGGAA